MVGENIDKHPEVFKQVLSGGHAVANHTYNHLKGWRCSLADYMANVAKCQEAIERHIPDGYPVQVPNLFRPPYGKTWIWQRRALLKAGYSVYLWDVLTRDYDKTRTPEAMLAQIKRETRPGSIINFHDSVKSNERMLAVLPRAIEWLQGEGYELKALNG
jgi:peptidoglycan/xylan/chitin deacetylase (PgdA/CDA1 family)